ncbi:VOC family protein [Humitalea sp. 24SJ18S-53]|uniref:VOC family protein n=1 Tax=Humitalea sp. 24SJ18S-53 TaxID=3422307 RepID=UPI003D66BD19
MRFYVDVLGFTCGLQTAGYANLTRDAVRIILAAPNLHRSWAGAAFTGQLYIALEAPQDVDALWEQIRKAVEVVYPIEDFEYGMREFGVLDDNGYQLTFGATRP